MRQSVPSGQAEESNWRTGTDTPATVNAPIRAGPGLSLATTVTSAEPIPSELPETVNQAGKPKIDQAQSLPVWMDMVRLPPAAAIPRLGALTA